MEVDDLANIAKLSLTDTAKSTTKKQDSKTPMVSPAPNAVAGKPLAMDSTTSITRSDYKAMIYLREPDFTDEATTATVDRKIHLAKKMVNLLTTELIYSR